MHHASAYRRWPRSLVLAVVLDLKARREEAWLADRYPDYDAYRAATHRFVPGLY